MTEFALPTADELAEDLGLLVMATLAFNMGIGAREDRDSETVARLDLAAHRVMGVFNIEFSDEL